DLSMPGAAGPRPARLYRPEARRGPAPTLLYLHGGGHVVCDLETHDDVCRVLAARSGVDVVSLDYRLAPEHRFPAAFDDAVAVFEALRDGAVEGLAPSWLAMGGDSAGGNLTAATALALARAGREGPAFQLLFYPLVDGTLSAPSYRTFAKGFALDDTEIVWFRASYLGPDGDPTDLRYSPLLVDAIPPTLGPTYVATAGFDPLRDEGLAWGARLEAAGVPVTQRCHDGLIHGFVSFIDVLDSAREAVEQAADALGAAAAGAQSASRPAK
ncbi:MAG: alpha/beta hydrolase, partial [Deltaproteobacteria bacterium]